MRNSLILTGRCCAPARPSTPIASRRSPGSSTWRCRRRSPLKLAGPEVTLNVALTLSPGATGPGIVSEPPPWTAALQPAGSGEASLTFVAGAPDVFVKVTMVSWLEPGANVCRPGGPPGVRSGRDDRPAVVVARRVDHVRPARLVELVARDVAGARRGLQRGDLAVAERAVIDLEVVDRRVQQRVGVLRLADVVLRRVAHARRGERHRSSFCATWAPLTYIRAVPPDSVTARCVHWPSGSALRRAGSPARRPPRCR